MFLTAVRWFSNKFVVFFRSGLPMVNNRQAAAIASIISRVQRNVSFIFLVCLFHVCASTIIDKNKQILIDTNTTQTTSSNNNNINWSEYGDYFFFIIIYFVCSTRICLCTVRDFIRRSTGYSVVAVFCYYFFFVLRFVGVCATVRIRKSSWSVEETNGPMIIANNYLAVYLSMNAAPFGYIIIYDKLHSHAHVMYV